MSGTQAVGGAPGDHGMRAMRLAANTSGFRCEVFAGLLDGFGFVLPSLSRFLGRLATLASGLLRNFLRRHQNEDNSGRSSHNFDAPRLR
jgi:hypothetical protein